MPNRLYNKQVSAKGYKRGGGVTNKKPNKSNFKSILKKASTLTPGGAGLALGKKISDRVKKMGGGMMKRSMYKRGGALKPVDPKTQKGLSKLPTEVRNKMGYMKKGGKVHGK